LRFSEIFDSGVVIVLELQRALHQPGLGVIGLFGGHGLQLLRGFRIPLRIEQRARVTHAQLGHRLALQVAPHDGLGLRQLGVHQLQREPCRPFRPRASCLAAARRLDGAGVVAGRQAQAPHGRPGGRRVVRLAQVVGERLLDDRCGEALVAHP
jgi:hypothetical protein